MFYQSFASKAAVDITQTSHLYTFVLLLLARFFSGEDATGNLLVQKHAAAFRKSEEIFLSLETNIFELEFWMVLCMQLISDL